MSRKGRRPQTAPTYSSANRRSQTARQDSDEKIDTLDDILNALTASKQGYPVEAQTTKKNELDIRREITIRKPWRAPSSVGRNFHTHLAGFQPEKQRDVHQKERIRPWSAAPAVPRSFEPAWPANSVHPIPAPAPISARLKEVQEIHAKAFKREAYRRSAMENVRTMPDALSLDRERPEWRHGGSRAQNDFGSGPEFTSKNMKDGVRMMQKRRPISAISATISTLCDSAVPAPMIEKRRPISAK